MERRVIVVGAGIAGLSAAWRIREQARLRNVDLDLTVLEASDSVGGKIASLGVDCVETEMTDLDKRYLEGKLSQYGMAAPNGVDNMIKLTSGKQLWNYDNLEPSEKKLVL